jgi:hypothetical protein
LKQDGLNDLIALLSSDLRRLPVVLLSSYANGEPNQIDHIKLARNLAGVAVVVSIEDSELTWDFADEVGRQLSCFDGGARIYWPGFSKVADPRNHRLFIGSWIKQAGSAVAARTIERAIFDVAAFRYVPDKRIGDLIRRAEAEERQKTLDQKRETGDEYWEDYQKTVDKLIETEEKLAGLEAENANLRANQQVFLAAGPESPDELEQTEPMDELEFSSVAEAVEAAALRCKNLEFLNVAKSAAAASPFQRPFDVFKALTDLDEIVDTWSKIRDEKGGGGDIIHYLRDRGWKRSSMQISDTTRGKFSSAYEFKYKGVKRLFEPHITIGAGDPNSCASIHFIFDQESLKIVIGHVGRHLPNTKT